MLFTLLCALAYIWLLLGSTLAIATITMVYVQKIPYETRAISRVLGLLGFYITVLVLWPVIVVKSLRG